jgi:hypothetical protein
VLVLCAARRRSRNCVLLELDRCRTCRPLSRTFYGAYRKNNGVCWGLTTLPLTKLLLFVGGVSDYCRSLLETRTWCDGFRGAYLSRASWHDIYPFPSCLSSAPQSAVLRCSGDFRCIFRIDYGYCGGLKISHHRSCLALIATLVRRERQSQAAYRQNKLPVSPCTALHGAIAALSDRGSAPTPLLQGLSQAFFSRSGLPGLPHTITILVRL